eukprot:COSAG04_NODE_4082_length_2316_cov_41.215607_2_plen_225_part_00
MQRLQRADLAHRRRPRVRHPVGSVPAGLAALAGRRQQGAAAFMAGSALRQRVLHRARLHFQPRRQPGGGAAQAVDGAPCDGLNNEPRLAAGVDRDYRHQRPALPTVSRNAPSSIPGLCVDVKPVSEPRQRRYFVRGSLPPWNRDVDKLRFQRQLKEGWCHRHIRAARRDHQRQRVPRECGAEGCVAVRHGRHHPSHYQHNDRYAGRRNVLRGFDRRIGRRRMRR